MVRSESRRDGAHRRLIVDQPKGNILSIAVMRDLRDALGALRSARGVKLVTIEGAGDHFSFGASVEEHRAKTIGAALTELHQLVRDLLDLAAPTAAVVRGRCLGGGFEVALACDFIFAAATATLGAPEIALGVFPPAASVLLPLKIGTSRAAHAVLTGEAAPLDVWDRAGLIEGAAPADGLEALVDRWFDTHLAARSAAALGCAAHAFREAVRQHVACVLPEVERLYLERLMRTSDAVEGIEAFIARRQPAWSHA